MILDVSNVRGEHTSLDELQGLQEALSLGGGKRYGALRVQRDGLSTLGLTASLAVLLQHVTSLTASYNRINTLQGVESFPCLQFLDLSHNALRVLDAHSTSLLRRLRRLQRCDFSHNELRLIDFDVSSRPSTARSDPLTHSGIALHTATTTPLNELAVLNLSHNQLIEVPDLRCMPVLVELNLEYNRIEFITDLDNRLPLLALSSLSISHNMLGTLQAMVPLTVLAETLTTLTVGGNPCLQDAAITKAAARPWLLWLLPRIETIDDISLSPQERQTAARLFRRRGELSHEAVEMMNSHHNAQLEAYLKKFALPPNTHSITDALSADREDQVGASVNHNNVCLSDSSLGGMRNCLPKTISFDRSTTKTSSRPASIELAMQMMHKKLKQLSSIMEVLWRESMKKRVLATVVLQKHARSFLTRRRLSPATRRDCARIRRGLLVARRRPPSAPQGMSLVSHFGAQGAEQLNSNDGNKGNGDTASTIMMMKMQMERFETQLRQWSIEMEEFRRIQARRKSAAAITIQRYYRGHVDRRRWRRLKECYNDFVASLRPNIVALQRVSRGYLVRLRLAHRRVRDCEVQLLRAEVGELRRIVLEMQQNMRRQRLERYADPEWAMKDIISRHTLPRASSSAAAAAAVALAVTSERITTAGAGYGASSEAAGTTRTSAGGVDLRKTGVTGLSAIPPSSSTSSILEIL